MRKINTEKIDQEKEYELYMDGKTKMISMPTIPSKLYVNVLKEVDDLLEEHGLEIILLNPQEFEMDEAGVSFRVIKRR